MNKQVACIIKGNPERMIGNEINADLNGSLNIIRKVAGDYCFVYQNNIDLVEGYVVSPLKVTICT